MHDGIGSELSHHALKCCDIRKVGRHEVAVQHRSAIPGGEIVIGEDGMPLPSKGFNNMAADISRAAGDKNVHVIGSLNSRILLYGVHRTVVFYSHSIFMSLISVLHISQIKQEEQ